METAAQSAFSLGAVAQHLIFGLLALSMLMHRFLYLRLAVIASALIGLFYWTAVAPNGVAAFWQCVLVLINIGHIAYAFWDDRTAQFRPEEQALVDQHFGGMRPSMARRLLKAGDWVDMEADGVLTIEGQTAPALYYLQVGHGSVKVGGFDIGTVRAGDLVGEMTVMTDDPASATVMLDVPSRLWQIDAETVRRLSAGSSEIGRGLESAFFRMLRARLIKRNEQDSEAKAHPYAWRRG